MSMSNRARRMMQHQLRNKADAELNLIPRVKPVEIAAARADRRRDTDAAYAKPR